MFCLANFPFSPIIVWLFKTFSTFLSCCSAFKAVLISLTSSPLFLSTHNLLLLPFGRNHMLHSPNGDRIFHVRLSVHFDYKWFVVKVIHRALIQGSSLSVGPFCFFVNTRSCLLISQPADLKNNERLFVISTLCHVFILNSPFSLPNVPRFQSLCGEKTCDFRTRTGRTRKDGSLAFQGKNVPSRLLKHTVCTKSYYHDILFVQHSFRIDLNKQIKTNAGTFHICTLNAGMKNPWTRPRSGSSLKGKSHRAGRIQINKTERDERAVHWDGRSCRGMTYCFRMSCNVFIFLLRYLLLKWRDTNCTLQMVQQNERRRCDDLHLCCDLKCDLILLGDIQLLSSSHVFGPVSALEMKIEWISSLFVICFQISPGTGLRDFKFIYFFKGPESLFMRKIFELCVCKGFLLVNNKIVIWISKTKWVLCENKKIETFEGKFCAK